MPSDQLTFFRAFVQNWRAVGFPLQTSKKAAQTICSAIDFESVQTVVELGAGLGRITRAVLQSLPPDGRIFAFETDPELCRRLREIDDPRLVVHNLSAEQVSTVVRGRVDCVVSGIPVANLSAEAQERLYTAISEVLDEDGLLIQLQLSLLSYRKVQQFFGEVSLRFEPANIPPLFMYLCRSPLYARWRPLPRCG